VFGIALGRIWREVDGTLAELPSERAQKPGGEDATTDSRDELAARRAMRTSS
jgi:hypothetical protein